MYLFVNEIGNRDTEAKLNGLAQGKTEGVRFVSGRAAFYVSNLLLKHRWKQPEL